MEPKTLLLAALVVIVVFYALFWFVTVRRQRAARRDRSALTPQPITHGHFLHRQFLRHARHRVLRHDDVDVPSCGTWSATRSIPGTLNVGYVLPTLIQALIFITIVEVDFTTLIVLIGGACAGAWLGAGVVAGMSRRGIQIGMGSALLASLADRAGAVARDWCRAEPRWR